ncbi:MAG: hypothetical protein AB7P04_05930 [Bacteriovoracia bacterium]
MKLGSRMGAFVALIAFFSTHVVGAAETYDYPELMVTPLASDRLGMLAKDEPGTQWTMHLPIQISALATTLAGITYTPKASVVSPDPTQAIAIGVGAGWLAVSTFLAATYKPYQSGLVSIKDLPTKTKRDQLTKECLAEEALEKPASLARRLMWVSIATNASASAYLLSKADTGTFGAIAMAAAFAPLLFQYKWQDVARSQREYKKRIYAPVAGATLLPEPVTGKLRPGVSLAFFF